MRIAEAETIAEAYRGMDDDQKEITCTYIEATAGAHRRGFKAGYKAAREEMEAEMRQAAAGPDGHIST